MFTLAPPPPHPSARPLHCGSCWALGHHYRLSVGTDGGPFGRGHTHTKKKKTAKVGGLQSLREPAASMPHCQRRGRILEVEEGQERLKRDFSFLLIKMQGRVSLCSRNL